ncbi:hypothetical protein CDO52_04980 [Nocardiopsis gilva YIM 90087]|uniref:Uncharacterized protein n=1 Tax=Nocardiopsis gilva YIM 90087 TaxID=1235441 RepID=A0A223S277_9ACTN|nr:hypothetical protein [Nocardiopsis gilva]ASU82224.1 hypothetical protein CDO52_04980 [Nocardiopsis gilva YIM 90087]
MTYDVVALVRQDPDMRALVDAMVDAGPDLRVRGVGGGAVVQLRDDDSAPLVSIEAAQRVDVPGEVGRLLGAETAARMPDPCWWVEVRASSAARGTTDTAALAHRFADALVERLGGTVWSSRPRPAGGGPAADHATHRIDTNGKNAQ